MGPKAEWIIIGILVLLLGIGVVAYIDSREAVIKAQAAEVATKTALATIAEHDAAAKAQLDARDKEIAALQDKLNSQLNAAKTPQDIAGLVAQFMNLQKPITFVTPPATASNPNPQPIAQVPVSDAPQVKAYVQACEQCKLDLETAKAKLTYQDQLISNDKVAMKAKDDEIKSWKIAAKGSFWGNTKKIIKYGVIGGGITLGILAGTGHVH